MNIIPLGSSSAGNCYIIEKDECYMILDAGLPIRRIKKHFPMLSKVSAAVITHEHGDHCDAYAGLLKAGVHVYLSKGTKDNLEPSRHHRAHEIKAYECLPTVDGKWSIMGLPAVHDSAEPLGFLIKHLASGETMYYMTDTGKFTAYVNNATHYMIECNYDPEIVKRGIEDGWLNEYHAKRVAKSHASINQVESFLGKCKLDKTESIYLLHLSNGNANEADFKERIQRVCGLPVYVCKE